MDLHKIKIETERLWLVPVGSEHLGQIFLEYKEPITTYMNHTSTGTMKELKERHKKWQREMKEGVRLFLSVLKKDSGEFLGCFALANIDGKEPEMGGWLKKSAHGNHYGQEAATALKEWADENVQYDHVTWPCATMNTPSRKLAESIGGKIKKKYKKTTASGNVWPYVEYWITKKEA